MDDFTVGFNYDVNGDGQGSGLFTGRFPFVWLGNQVQNVNSWYHLMVDPDYQFPQVWQNIGLDQSYDDGLFWMFRTQKISMERMYSIGVSKNLKDSRQICKMSLIDGAFTFQIVIIHGTTSALKEKIDRDFYLQKHNAKDVLLKLKSQVTPYH